MLISRLERSIKCFSEIRLSYLPLNLFSYIDILFHRQQPNLSTILQNGAGVGNEPLLTISGATVLQCTENTVRNLSRSPRYFNLVTMVGAHINAQILRHILRRKSEAT